MARRLKINKISEHAVQKTICDWLDWHNIFYFSIPNESATSGFTGKRLNDRGRKKGASDLFVGVATKGFNGFFLEVKTIGGKVSPEQKDFFEKASKNNYFTSACWTVEEGLEILEWYLFG